MKLNICHLYPDVLNNTGDAGNILCLVNRLKWRGIDAEVCALSLGQGLDFSRFDLFFIGGGEAFERELVMNELNKNQAHEIIAAVEDGKVFFAVCGGYQLLGQYYKDGKGRQYELLGAVDSFTLESETRMTGNLMFRCDELNEGLTMVGFENHSGKTYLGTGVSPLGTVLSGFGNNGEDKLEGLRYNNVFATYANGPLLPKNPEFADMLLETALLRREPGLSLSPLSDEFELKAHEYMVKRLT